MRQKSAWNGWPLSFWGELAAERAKGAAFEKTEAKMSEEMRGKNTKKKKTEKGMRKGLWEMELRASAKVPGTVGMLLRQLGQREMFTIIIRVFRCFVPTIRLFED